MTAAVAGPARGEDARVQAAVTDGVPQVEATVRRSDDRDPAGAQAIYDAARDLDERLRAAAGVSPRCRPLLDAARVYATARVTQAEAMDRPAYTSSTPARLRAEAARARVQSLAGSCADRGRGPGAAPWTMTPRSDEAFFGTVVARVPARAVTAVVRVDGGEHGRVVVGDGGRVRSRVSVPAGPHTLEVRAFDRGGRQVARIRSDRVVLLPGSARVNRPAGFTDTRAEGRLAALGTAAPGITGLWVQNLATGRAAGANADAAFPAASLVKLGLLVATLGHPGDLHSAGTLYDVGQVARWSGNLATNRLLRRVGGSEAGGAALAQAALARMGARSSTFPGGYIAGTALGAPPRVSQRVTSARDMAAVLAAIHAAAVGDAAARRATGLTTQRARLLLGLLAGSEQVGENLSLFRGALPAGTPVAEKRGWLRAAHHSAAILYTPTGPRIAVVLSYSTGGTSLNPARTLGADVARVATGLR